MNDSTAGPSEPHPSELGPAVSPRTALPASALGELEEPLAPFSPRATRAPGREEAPSPAAQRAPASPPSPPPTAFARPALEAATAFESEASAELPTAIPIETPSGAPAPAPAGSASSSRSALDEVADRLGAIASELRNGLPADLLATDSTDPLRLLVVGYALGYQERVGRADEREESA